METLIDDNFLNGKLTIVSRPENNVTIGKLDLYDETIDDFITFTTCTICDELDTFDISKGQTIVKLKLAKLYYTYYYKNYKSVIRDSNKTIKFYQDKLKFVTDKLAHINYELSKFIN